MAKVKFGDVVKEVKNKIDRNNNPYEFYVAGDHMDTDSLSIPRKGSFLTDDVGPAFVREFKNGQVLYGSRRTYLRKVAVADFDGVTANTTFVLETKDENVLRQRLLPFIMYTEGFTAWSIKKSRGSTNPYVLFKDLADYEFDLPSIEEQDRLAEVLWSINDTLQAYQNLLTQTDALVQAQFVEMFGDPVENPMKWPIKNLSALGTCKNGMNFSSREQGIAIRCVGVADIKDYNYIEGIDNLTLLSLNEMPSEEYLLHNGDIVFVRSNGNKDLVGRCVAVYPDDIPVTFSGFCIRFRKADEDVLLDYLLRLLKLPEMRAKMAGRGANIQNLNQKILSSLLVPVPPKNLQETYIQTTKQSDKAKSTLQNTITSLQATKRSILERALGTGRKE